MVLFLLLAITIYFSGCRRDVVDKNAQVVKTEPDSNEVWIQSNMSFYPATITVKANTTIKWTNKDTQQHWVFSDSDFTVNSQPLDGGLSYTHVFTTVRTLYVFI